jgi:SAM-dependent methyltransferase
VPRGWQWDETLFRGSAPYYQRGRLPYAPGVAEAVASTLGLDGRGRLLDVGCGPGVVALQLAQFFEQVIGLDPDAEMLIEARRRAVELGIGNARWLRALAEFLPLRDGSLRVASFGRSFHWLARERVAAAIYTLLEVGGAFVQIGEVDAAQRADWLSAGPLPYPLPPEEAMQELARAYLGPVRRAGQGVLAHGTPDGEALVLAHAGFTPPTYVFVPGPDFVVRTVDDLVAARFSSSSSAPHLFGARLAAFEADLRALLRRASPSGRFAERPGPTELRFWRKPPI